MRRRLTSCIVGIATILIAVLLGEWEAQAATRPQDAIHELQQVTGAEVKCTNGKAAAFDCHNADLVAYLPPSALGATLNLDGKIFSGMWGWTDTATGREFALVGRNDGTAFVEVTDPVRPRYLGDLPIPAAAEPSLWREIKVYKNHAFIVSDNAGTHGMQVFDLTQLRKVTADPVTFQTTAQYDGIATAHSIAINEESGYAYVVGANIVGIVAGKEPCGGGLHIVDIRTPKRPKFVTCFPQPKPVGQGYVHDLQCVLYRGPDRRYRNREICLNAAVNILGLVDVTDKQKPKPISSATYPNLGMVHQGWLSEDQRYFFLGDEGDEAAIAQQSDPNEIRTRTIVFDLEDLQDPVVIREFYGNASAIDHNQYVRDGYLYQGNYTAGLRVIDVRNPAEPKEVGSFDTTPSTAGLDLAGAWTTYPYFKSGVIGVSSIGEGLFLIRFRPPVQKP